MLPEDCRRFVRFLQARDPVVVTLVFRRVRVAGESPPTGNWVRPEPTPSSIRSGRESDHKMLIDAGSRANSMVAASLPLALSIPFRHDAALSHPS